METIETIEFRFVSQSEFSTGQYCFIIIFETLKIPQKKYNFSSIKRQSENIKV